MDNFDIKKQSSEDGFTLVELAVVMIIIGLLIGGILKGQELITNARVTKTASEFEALGAAHNGFRDKYNALPGDMADANIKISECPNFAACGDGNGNSIVNRRFGTRPFNNGATRESIFYFGQLLAAGFISNMEGSADGIAGTVGFGVTNPTAPIGGGFIVGDTRATTTSPLNFTQQSISPGVYVMITADPSQNAVDTNGVLTNAQAANIDRRLDDGAPWTGTIVADNSCDDESSPIAYNEDIENSVCVIAYRM